MYVDGSTGNKHRGGEPNLIGTSDPTFSPLTQRFLSSNFRNKKNNVINTYPFKKQKMQRGEGSILKYPEGRSMKH